MSNRAIATLYADGFDPAYLDVSWYRGTQNSCLKTLDFCHSNVTNCVAASHLLVQDSYKHFHPRYNTVRALDTMESVPSTTLSNSLSSNLESTSQKIQSSEEQLKSEKMVHYIVEALRPEKYYDNLVKLLGYFLHSCGIETKHPEVYEHYQYFRKFDRVEFQKHVCSYVGTRWSAERERNRLREIIRDFNLV